jgi:hypothetical protein
MPIRINLLAEAQAAEEMRRRDPVKRALWIGGFLVALMLLWCLSLYLGVLQANSERTRSEKEWTQIEPDYIVVSNNIKRITALDSKLSALARLSTNRFLWGSTFNAFQQLTADLEKARLRDIYLARVRGEQIFVISNLPPVKVTNAPAPVVAGAPAPKAAKPPPPKQVSLERITIKIDARDYGNASLQNYLKYPSVLSAFPYFKEKMSSAGAQLKGYSPPSDTKDPGHPFVEFNVEMKLLETKRDE